MAGDRIDVKSFKHSIILKNRCFFRIAIKFGQGSFIKGIILNVFDIFAQGDASQIGAIPKRPITNGVHTIARAHALHTGAFKKRIITNIGYIIGDFQFLQLGAVQIQVMRKTERIVLRRKKV